MQYIDTTGLSCPQPMLMVKKNLETMSLGSVTVLADSAASRENICRCAQALGWKIHAETLNNDVWSIEFTKAN